MMALMLSVRLLPAETDERSQQRSLALPLTFADVERRVLGESDR